MDEPLHVAIVGNLTEGFRVFGPYNTFEDASEAHDFSGLDVWIVSLEPPRKEPAK